jgi:hypothetical protein
MDHLGLSVTVLMRVNGRNVEAREYRSAQDGNTYIEGREGSEFIVRIMNRTHKRVLAIPSVDGLSTLDGKPAGAKSRGFVLDPFTKVDVEGWLRPDQKAAAFFFSGMKDGVDGSYVAQIGQDADQKGVIGVLFLAEDRPFRPAFPNGARMAAASPGIYGSGSVMRSAQAMNMAAEAQSMGATLSASSADVKSHDVFEDDREQTLGTGYGREKHFGTTAVPFARGAEITRIRIDYDDERGLKRRGIDVRRPLSRRPEPFPADRTCPAPPGWHG